MGTGKIVGVCALAFVGTLGMNSFSRGAGFTVWNYSGYGAAYGNGNANGGTVHRKADGVNDENGFASNTTTFGRWEQAQITYSFTPAFASQFGAGGENAVRAAFSTWQGNQFTLFNALPGTTVGRSMNLGTDFPLWTANGAYDLQSIALHEIGHAIGLDHPDIAGGTYDPGALGRNPDNFNVNGAGAWVRGPIANPLLTFNDGPNGGGNYDTTKTHPVMWSTIGTYNVYRTPTNDDIYALQYLYDDIQTPGNGTGHAGGPIFGNAAGNNVADRLNFMEIATGGNIIIDVNSANGALASTVDNEAAKGGADTYGVISAARIEFLPEPTSATLMVGGLMMLIARRARKA